MSAASFTTFARSARKPGVPRAIDRRSTSASSSTFRVCTDLLAAVEIGIADHHLTVEPPRPEQRRVEDVGPDLVAATTTMLSAREKPSISTSSWLSVCSRSSWLRDVPPRFRPTASSSSMKTMHDCDAVPL